MGSERLKTCELFAEILHLQYLYTSSPLFEKLLVTPEAKKPSVGAEPSPMEGVEKTGSAESTASVESTANVADELIAVTDKFIDAKVLPVCLV